MSRRKQGNAVWALGGALLLLAVLAGAWIYGRAKENHPQRMILIQKAMDETDFWASISEGASVAAREFDVDLKVVGPAHEQLVGEQNRMILEAIGEKPDAIALAPASYEETLPYAKKILEAGIRLVLVDSTMEEELDVPVIATDNFAAGFKLGAYMKQFVTEDTVIGVVSHVEGSSTAMGREAGFRAGLGEAQEQIAETVFCDSLSDKAYEETCGLLEKYPRMDLIVGLNEYSAVGAARAVKDSSRAESIRMAGIDSSMEQIQFLEAGIYEALVIQKPFNMGYLGIETAWKVGRGEKAEPYRDSGSELITRENMYTEENQKLLFPFFGGRK